MMVSCEECGLVVGLRDVQNGHKAQCPRCYHTLIIKNNQPFECYFSYGSACLIMLVLSLSFPFVSFSVQGVKKEITLPYAIEVLRFYDNELLAILLLFTIVILPASYIVLGMYLYIKARWKRNDKESRLTKWLCRVTFLIEPWIMVDVFLIGILVSFVKILSLADIGLGMSFWAFCAYALLVVKCVSIVDRTWVWQQLFPTQRIEGVKAGDSHTTGNHVSCSACWQINPLPTQGNYRCSRCGKVLQKYSPHLSQQRAWAFLIASALLYIPANLYPIMYTVSLGNEIGSTIIGGVLLLWQLGSYPIAAVIFFASVVIPLAKIICLGQVYYKALHSKERSELEIKKEIRLYRISEFIGRWSMIDIFVVAILVALIQLQSLMTITPGPAALPFALVVISTMLSAISFDSRVLWDASNSSINNENMNFCKKKISISDQHFNLDKKSNEQ